jgi:prevent-host-death family protein
MMQRISLQDAQTELQELIAAAVQGETILIVGDGEQVVQLVPVAAPEASGKRKRKAGSAQGLITMSDDFDAPLPDFDEYMN